MQSISPSERSKNRQHILSLQLVVFPTRMQVIPPDTIWPISIHACGILISILSRIVKNASHVLERIVKHDSCLHAVRSSKITSISILTSVCLSLNWDNMLFMPVLYAVTISAWRWNCSGKSFSSCTCGLRVDGGQFRKRNFRIPWE